MSIHVKKIYFYQITRFVYYKIFSIVTNSFINREAAMSAIAGIVHFNKEPINIEETQNIMQL